MGGAEIAGAGLSSLSFYEAAIKNDTINSSLLRDDISICLVRFLHPEENRKRP